MEEAMRQFAAHAADAQLALTPDHERRLMRGAEWLAAASGASGLSQYRDPSDALLRAMGPALAYFHCPHAPVAGCLADIGAGSGAIGATIGLFAPEMQIDLVDRARRAYTTAEMLAARMGLSNVTPRLCDIGQLSRQYDVVLFRALAQAEDAMALAASVAAPGGLVGAYRRRSDERYLRPAGALHVLGTHDTPVPELVLTCYRR